MDLLNPLMPVLVMISSRREVQTGIHDKPNKNRQNLESEHEYNIWFFHLCEVMLRAATLNKLGLKRNNHINRTQKGVSRDQVYTVRPRVSIVQSAPGRLMVGGWKCSMCLQVFPPLPHSSRLASIDAHLDNCFPGKQRISNAENCRRVFMTMGGCKIPRGQAPAPKAFSIAVQTANNQ